MATTFYGNTFLCYIYVEFLENSKQIIIFVLRKITDMKKSNKKPQFFALYKDFNNGSMKTIDVLQYVFDSILNTKGGIRKKDFFILDKKWNRVEVRTKEQCEQFVSQILRYYFWSKCEWEFVCIDWPYRDSFKESNPVKIDVYDQLEPNIPVINDLVWNYIEPKVQKLIKEENE